MSEDTMKNGYDPANLDQPSANVVDFQDVVKKFGSKTVLDGVSFAIKPGSVFALLGENGAGKTTTIRMVLGETAPTSGLILRSSVRRIFAKESASFRNRRRSTST